MVDLSTFRTFMARIHAGDEAAAHDLVSRFGGLIRREVRLRMYDRRLLRMVDSMDIAQSVLNSFFSRAGTGQYEVETPEQLARLLIGMARNKLASQRRRQYARRRDSRRTEPLSGHTQEMVSGGPSPVQVADDRDLIDTVMRRLGSEERQMIGLRAEGFGWVEIAGRLGGSPQARRMQLARAVHRASRALEPDGPDG